MSLNIAINYSEFECGHPCTPDGCRGHKSSIPDTITINGFDLHLDGFDPDTDDFPFRGEQPIDVEKGSSDDFDHGHDLKAWKAMVAELAQRLKPHPNLNQKIGEAVERMMGATNVAQDHITRQVFRSTIVDILAEVGVKVE